MQCAETHTHLGDTTHQTVAVSHNQNSRWHGCSLNAHAVSQRDDQATQRNANFNRFPCNGFTYSLTFFPKCFSSFPHGTCSLSVSCQYLALDEVYHPFWAAFPNNPTPRKCDVLGQATGHCATTGFSPSVMPCSKETWTQTLALKHISKLQFNRTNARQISNLGSSRFTRRYWGNPC